MNREEIDYNKLASEEHVDFLNALIEEGDILLKADRIGSSPIIMRVKVTSIKDGKIYLDYSKIPIKYPGRCVNLTKLGGK